MLILIAIKTFSSFAQFLHSLKKSFPCLQFCTHDFFIFTKDSEEKRRVGGVDLDAVNILTVNTLY